MVDLDPAKFSSTSYNYDYNFDQSDIAVFCNVANIYLLVNDFFKDPKKSWCWIYTPNNLLGGISPYQMIRCGRTDKLTRFIEYSLDENKLDD